jgi:hypothetical protein
MPKMRTDLDIGEKTPKPQRFRGFIMPFFKVEFKRYHFPKTTFGEELKEISGHLGTDFAIYFAESAPFCFSDC